MGTPSGEKLGSTRLIASILCKKGADYYKIPSFMHGINLCHRDLVQDPSTWKREICMEGHFDQYLPTKAVTRCKWACINYRGDNCMCNSSQILSYNI